MPVPALRAILADAHVVTLPMTTRFRGVTEREALVFRGSAGWAEFSPFAEYPDAEAAVWLAAAIDAAWEAPPPAHRDAIPVNATVPAVATDGVAAVVARFDGCRTAKVKVAERGQVLADDVARVGEVRRILGPEARIRIDANGGWNVDEAEHAVHELAPFDLEYVEQPCATVPELAEVRSRIRHLGIPVAADESVRRAEDPLAVAEAGAADLLVIKAQPLGGVRRALEIVRAAGLPAVVSSALDTSIGLAMGARLAAALPELEYDCGLGTASLFADDVAATPLRPVDGRIPVRPVEPDPDALTRLAAPGARRDWWTDRLSRAHAVLDG